MHGAMPHATSSARGMHAGFQNYSSLEAATGRPVVNLDDWLMSQEDIVQSFRRHAADADLCIVDGVAGLIDGRWDRWAARPHASLQLLALHDGQTCWQFSSHSTVWHQVISAACTLALFLSMLEVASLLSGCPGSKSS